MTLGGHDEADFRSAEFIVVNPAVRLDHPLLEVGRAAGARLTSEIELFLRACPAAVIGVTGSNGKSTTVSLLAAMLEAGDRRTWLGGNIGGSLLADVDAMTAADWVVLELSSFQLAHLNETAPRPVISLVTNCAPNHLDWHGGFDAYRTAKLRIIDRRSASARVVLNTRNPETASWASLLGVQVCDPWPDAELPVLPVPGEHNRQNAACAAAVAELAGVDRASICRAAAAFRGLNHRIQWVREFAGRGFYDDSKATTPEASQAALTALAGGACVWLLAGGQSKGADYRDWAGTVAERARAPPCLAPRGELLEARCVASPRFDSVEFETLSDAFDWCWRRSAAGDAILLSPACASLDQFRDFVARGEAFCRLGR